MSGASSLDDGRKMDNVLKAMSSASSCDDSRKMDSVLTAMSSASGSDDGRKMSKGQGSSSVEEADQGGNRKMHKRRRASSVEGADKGGEVPLKKGPWTREEDAILKEHVKNHGEGNWNAVQKYSGLARCGKSCRFRWTNHLKPNLKKGAITAEEEQRIVELHARMGNKWSKMAAELPGRTDNEIKNFWNTRVKRRQRAGQTTYPKEVEIYRQQVHNGNQENLNPDAALTKSFGIPDVEFERLKLPLCISDMLSQQYNMLPRMHHSVSDMLADVDQSTHSSRGSDMIYNSCDPSAVPTFDQYDTSDPRLLSRYDPIFNTSDQFGNFLTGSYASLIGTISASSDPISGAFNVDLPSVQNFESVDTPESSIQFQPNQSVPVTHQNNDGLLESISYGSKNSNGSNNVDSFQQNNDHFVPYEAIQNSTLNSNGSNNVDSFQENNDHCVLNEEVQNSTLNPYEKQCDESEALRSSLGPFAASVVAEDAYITNFIRSMKTTENHRDKHGALTKFSPDSPSPENQNPKEFLFDCHPAPDLSFMKNDSPSLENQNPIEILLDRDLVPDWSFMENDSPCPENQNPIEILLDRDLVLDWSFMENDSPSPENQNLIEFLLDCHPAPDLSFMENDSLSLENQNPIQFLLDPGPSPDLSYIENCYFNDES